MRCSNCGEQVGMFDRSCAACGADVTTLPPMPAAAGPEVVLDDRAEASVAVTAPAPVGTSEGVARSRRRWTRSTSILVAAALVAAAAVGGLALSRADLSGQLSTTQAALEVSRARLEDAQHEADELTRQVSVLEGAVDDAETEADRATAATENVQRSLTACQDVFRASAKYFGKMPPPSEQAELASLFVICFEGQVPPSLFP